MALLWYPSMRQPDLGSERSPYSVRGPSGSRLAPRSESGLRRPSPRVSPCRPLMATGVTGTCVCVLGERQEPRVRSVASSRLVASGIGSQSE